MNLLVTKLLFGLGLWVISLIFGLAIPFLMRKQSKTKSNEHESLENENLLSNGDDLEHRRDYGGVSDHGRSPLLEDATCCSSVKRWLRRRRDAIFRHDIASLINCVCAGLFLGICFLELLPECRDGVDQVLTQAAIKTKLPVTEFMVCVGLLFVMLIEQLVSSACARRHVIPTSDDCDAIDYPDLWSGLPNLNIRSTNSPLPEDDSVEGRSVPAVRVAVGKSACDVDASFSGSFRGELHEHPDQAGPSYRESQSSEYSGEQQNRDSSNAARSVVLITMLSLHSIFEGLALGLEATFNNLVQLFVAIVVHKCVIAFSLGLNLFTTFAPSRTFVAAICMLIFSSGSPLGCAIGSLMSLSVNTTESTTVAPPASAGLFLLLKEEESLAGVPPTLVASAILECLATGTFLYVTFVEVIPMEFSHASDHDVINAPASHGVRGGKVPIRPMVKLLALLCGFATVSGLQFV